MDKLTLLAFLYEQSHVWLVQTENTGELHLFDARIAANHCQDSVPRWGKTNSSKFGMKRLEASLLEGAYQKTQRVFDL
ncbi:hypothetical protein AGR7C_pAt0081 [Agrobacterium deltaense Zutra 3/1]|uniref:Uncharacterized protein n=1 Tax=Agrobacterium deltaense Zutra 3/1 TaxID=1183427 RepID=A0A1S7S2F0_9HYPH|nr:hypothetical protein AGR7C_pAt0081 [Agrobacterium deltaense Zutra 3/1]